MKRIVSFLIVAIVSLLIFLDKPKAYVRVESDVEFFNPKETSIIVNGQFNWGEGSQVLKNGPWIYSPGQYFAVGGVSGDNLIVDADYYFGVRGLPFTDSAMNNYLNNPRNTLTSSNLRCGIGAYGVGYDGTYLPQVTNFEVTFEEASNYSGNYILYHIRFTYNQRIKEVTSSNTNVWCFFQRNPRDGLFLQPSSPNGGAAFYYYSYTRSLKYAVTSDPNTKLLTELTNQNQVLIDQTKDLINNTFQLINKIDDLKDSITDDSAPDISDFGDVSGWLPPGPVDSIITLPLNALNSVSSSLNSKCTKLSLHLPFIDKELELMCGTEFYSSISGLSLFLNALFTILGGITLYRYFVYLYNWIDRIVSMEDKDKEKWGAT